MSVLGSRIKHARLVAGMSQEKLGVLAGIDEASAGTRISRYERGSNVPSLDLVASIADALNTPECYFYCADDTLAAIILAAHKLSSDDQEQLLTVLRQWADR